jgi:2-iminoacetate synthase
MVVAMRIFLPRAGISLSTRESPELRDRLVGLGITRMSAGSKTSVGGHATTNERPEGSRQFDISDPRDVDQIRAMLSEKGYQPVLKDWVRI